MKKNTLFNRIFHSKEVKASKEKYELSKKLVGFGPETLQFINGATTLYDLLNAHKIAWSRGYQNKDLGPCEYGMFRTKDIANMTADEVFLGNIYGLWTFPLSKWAEHTPSPAGQDYGYPKETTDIDLIMKQYRTLLRVNVDLLIYEAKDFISDYENSRKISEGESSSL